jgi:hypothetical protein
VFVDRPTQKVDLALTRPAWEVAFNATSDTATRLRVRIDPVHCTRQGTCDTFYDEQVIAVFRSDRQIRAQTALDNFAEKITATVRQESAVRAGTPGTVMIDVAIPDSITDRDVDNLAITMQSLRYPPGPGDPPSTKELTGRAQVISFPYEVTSTHARDMEPLVGFQVRGRWQDVVLTHDLQLPVHVDVHSDNFVQRNLVAAVGVLVGLATITGVAIGARRGHGPPP